MCGKNYSTDEYYSSKEKHFLNGANLRFNELWS